MVEHIADLQLEGKWTLTLDQQEFFTIDDGMQEKILVSLARPAT
jgi:hypothetical protein